MQVDPNIPGQMVILENRLGSDDLIEVCPTWGYSRAARTGNITWLHNLGKSNQERMYVQVVKTVVDQVKDALNAPNTQAAAEKHKRGYEVVAIPADGRCGWRAFLASQDVVSFRRVPRTLLFSSAYTSEDMYRAYAHAILPAKEVIGYIVDK